MSDIYFAFIYIIILALGFTTPFIFTYGYIWVDVFYPQMLSAYLSSVPVAMLMGAAAFGAYFLADGRHPPRPNLTMMLTLLMAAWVTATTVFWAVAPGLAWTKWDWAFKTIVISAFLPFSIRSRVQIEGFIQVYIMGAMIHLLPFGVKSMISGGGYGQSFGVLGSNVVGLSESSTLSAVAIMFIPIMLYLRRHSLLVPWPLLRSLGYSLYIVICVFAALGTFARTAIIGFAVLAAILWLQSRHKFRLAVFFAVSTAVLLSMQSDRWKERISTIEAPSQEDSASHRVLVWKWTLNFANENPQGGGFNSYIINRIEDSNGRIFTGKAFHSIYFEILGEHGWIGLALFLAIAFFSLTSLIQTIRRSRSWPQLAWCGDLAKTLLSCLLIMLACGAFIGIAFQPMFWYIFALATCLQQYMRRVLAEAALPA